MYLTIKSIHLTLVAISISLFLFRGMLMITGNAFYRRKLFRIIPPVVDTLLLISGVSLMLYTQQYPTTQSWLGVKLTALVVYILLGIIALNRVNHYTIQIISFFAASLVVAFMVSVALSHNPLGFLVVFNP